MTYEIRITILFNHWTLSTSERWSALMLHILINVHHCGDAKWVDLQYCLALWRWMLTSDELFCLHSSTIPAFWHDWLSELTTNRNGVGYWESYSPAVQCHNTNHRGEIVHLTMSAVVISCTGSSIILQDNLKSLYRKQQFLAKSSCSPLNIVENFSQVSQKLCLSSHIHCTCLFTTNQSYIVFCISLRLSTRDLWWKLGAKNLFITYKYQNKVVIRITLSLVYFR